MLLDGLLSEDPNVARVPIPHFGFIDDFRLVGQKIHNVPILGNLSDLSALITKHRIEELIIAVTAISSEKMRQIVEQCRTLGVRFKSVPRIGDLLCGRMTNYQLRDVDISDLLKRSPKDLDTCSISNLVNGKCVLITGAGGSIGTELCLQVARFGIAEMILVEKSENHLYTVCTKIGDQFPQIKLYPYLISTTKSLEMERIFATHRPYVVFHAAAYKHVHICEENICETVINNVEGTVHTARLSHQYNVHKFVFISTDKAVNPVGVMGMTKRVGELCVQAMNHRSDTQFITVRFGNVLESSGSAIPRFKEQIQKGGPVTITHPEATRYLMLLEEAIQLILQATSMGRGGEIFVLDMGQPIRIIDMAKDLIALMGFRPEKDIPITFSGLRPGEKLHERLFEASSKMSQIHSGLLVTQSQAPLWEELKNRIDNLLWHAQDNPKATLAALREICTPESGATFDHPITNLSQ